MLARAVRVRDVAMSELTRHHYRRRTMALAVVVAAYVLSFFQRFAPAGIAQDLITAFHTTASSLGVLAATYFYVYTVMQVPTGVLVDTLGPRHWRPAPASARPSPAARRRRCRSPRS